MRGLGQLDSTVMCFVWAADGPVTVREVVESLQRERSIAYTTVMTVMENLHSKGFLGRELVGRAHAYRATRGREQYEAELMEEVLSSTSDRSATLMHFVEQICDPASAGVAIVSAEELADLRSLVAQLDDTARR